MLRFPVLTDEELKNPVFLPADYDFVFVKAEYKKSKAGNMMFEVGAKIQKESSYLILTDYILSPEGVDDKEKIKRIIWKISMVCKCIGKPGIYKTGGLSTLDLLDQGGRCSVVTRKNEESGKEYLAIKSYLPRADLAEDDFKPDDINDIPF
jgi:hypothetical protein